MSSPLPFVPPSSDRLHGLDAVRGIALLLGVVLHASMSFLPGAQYFWVATDSDPSTALALTFYVIHMFRMLAFFLLAGYFAHLAFHRLGARRFAQDRIKRIVAPLLIGWPLAITAITVVLVWGAMLANGGELPKESPPGPAFTPDDFPLTHLWFLYDLLICYVVVVGVRTVVAAFDRRERLRAGVDRTVRVLSSAGGPLLLALPLGLSLYFQPGEWFMWFGIPTPDRALYPNLPAAVGFGSAFALGWLLQRQPDLLRTLERRWAWHGLVAVAATSGCLALVGLSPLLPAAPRDFTTLTYAIGYGVAAWSWTFALIGLALRFLSGYSAVRRYLADASYWIYLVHLPLVMALQVGLARWPAPWAVKFPLILVLAFAVMLLSYQLLVRYSVIGAMLNGRRQRRPGARVDEVATVTAPGRTR